MWKGGEGFRERFFVTFQLELQIGLEVSDVRFEGHHKSIPGGLTVAVRATDTLKPTINTSFLLILAQLKSYDFSSGMSGRQIRENRGEVACGVRTIAY